MDGPDPFIKNIALGERTSRILLRTSDRSEGIKYFKPTGWVKLVKSFILKFLDRWKEY